ncbi:MAG: hypothetical protein ACYC9O_16620 [Candidatus Latescibacterota bacterium]
MRRRDILRGILLLPAGAVLAGKVADAEILPAGPAKPALELPWLPDRLHAFVWRNWESVSAERMAEVLGATPDQVREIGRSMGLPTVNASFSDFLERGYISLIRRNWHLLPYEQLLTLLGWDEEKLAFTLKEDDFFWVKLGSLKPKCEPLRYSPPNETVMKRCSEIRKIVERHFGKAFGRSAEPRFFFVRELSGSGDGTNGKYGAYDAGRDRPIRFLYSYCAVFGDPLLHPELDPYPEGLLRRLAEQGVTGVWMHTVLRQLAPGGMFPGESPADAAKRRENLRKLAERTARYGIRIYLYMNEPRAMPESFFKGREHLKGGKEGDQIALCTSVPEVREWLASSLRQVFSEAPDLGGVFTITGSENFTHCHSHGRNASGCPRCSVRPGPEVAAEVNGVIARGVWEGNPDAAVIAWDWGWPDDWAEAIIKNLPERVYLQSVSEWGKSIERGGIASRVGEYSISSVGPGPRASKHWALAKKRGLRALAKVQVNASWELSALPYLPVMNLVAEHCANLAAADVDALMLSWSVGGFPSPNLELVRRMTVRPAPAAEDALRAVAVNRYGEKAASDALRAWTAFSGAFREYPFHVGFVYRGPAQMGPANPLWPEPTGYASTMVGFPYDDVDGWRAIYPAETLAAQFEKVAAGWMLGIPSLERALKRAATPDQQRNAREDLRIAEAAELHFRSIAAQVRFTMARNEFRTGSLSPAEREQAAAIIRKAAGGELEAARKLFTLARQDSRIGYEASNHYYYLPLDLVEKAVNCEFILGRWKEQ